MLEQRQIIVEKDKQCVTKLKMYFLLLRAFNGQTNVFNDIVNLLPKFQKLGINTLWLSPPQPQTAAAPPMFALNDHGYWPSDHGKIDPILGGEIAFEHLIKEAHRYGIEIAIDAVLNHFGYADEVILNGEKILTSNPNYFVIIPAIQSTYNRHNELNWKIEESLDVENILQYREELSQYPLFDLPTLRKDHSHIRTYLLDSYKKFIDMKITTFRIDAAKHMPAEFLIDFSNQLNNYSLTQWNRPVKFIWEVYICNSHALSKFIQGTLESLNDSSNTFFYDFPMRHEFKRIQDPNYRFEWLVSFVQYREQTQQYLNHLIPLVEDHDDGLPINNPFIARMIYVLTEFYSRNSTFIYHGSEQTGIRTVNRPRINTINEFGDIALLVDRLGHRLLSYRTCQETQTLFHVIEQDFLVSEKQLTNKRSIFLAMNKSSISRTIELSLQVLYGENQITFENILEANDSHAELIFSSKILRLTVSPFHFLIIEIQPVVQ
ncbi:unnamed protein product [Adineta steineri]|uniref:Alpha-amylase n=1 Tax=Adineta steineri TaxID=433720 RepID=A0A819R6W5_9BILA|nr:unnamed protein product [Adineta steineri]CAF4039750.1 unnamed protein product [Adineta steineri]